MTKATWGFVVLVVLIIAAGWWYQRSQAPKPVTDAAPSSTESSGTTPPSPLPSGSATSDAALDTDARAIDAQIQGFATDDANTSASLSDAPLSQESL